MNETDVQAEQDIKAAVQMFKDFREREARTEQLAKLNREIAKLDDEIARKRSTRQLLVCERERLLGMNRSWARDAEPQLPRFGI